MGWSLPFIIHFLDNMYYKRCGKSNHPDMSVIRERKFYIINASRANNIWQQDFNLLQLFTPGKGGILWRALVILEGFILFSGPVDPEMDLLVTIYYCCQFYSCLFSSCLFAVVFFTVVFLQLSFQQLSFCSCLFAGCHFRSCHFGVVNFYLDLPD